MEFEFEWDAAKAATNIAKHGVSFEEAVAVFADPRRRTFVDDRSDYGERRSMTVGRIRGREYSVVHTQRDGAIRIISARKANPRERRYYAEGPVHPRS